MPAVPRVLNRFHDKIVQGALAAGGLKAKLFVRACEAKVRRGRGDNKSPSDERRREGGGYGLLLS